MKVISILNKKGGVGKTTISTNLAHGLQLRGFKVLLADGDPQGSARDWHAANGGEIIPCIGLDRDTIATDIKAVAGQYDYIIIDGAPQVDKLSIAAIRASDIVFIPVQPSPYDIWATAELVEMINQRKELTGGKPASAFIINRVIKKTLLSKDIDQALAEYDFPILSSTLSQYVAYASTADAGESVFSSTTVTAASLEFNLLIQEITEKYLDI